MSYTKGSWWIGDVIETAEIEVKSDGGGLICLVTHECVKPDEENEANANLIAAAPDLLDALRDIKNDYENASYEWSGGDVLKKARRIIQKCETAIAKAEGKS